MHFLLEKVNFYCHASLLEGNNPSTPTFHLSIPARPRHVRVAIWIFLSAESIQQSHGWLTPPGGEARSGWLCWDATDEPKGRQSCTTPHGFHHSGQPKIGSKMANPKKHKKPSTLERIHFHGKSLHSSEIAPNNLSRPPRKKPHSAPRLDLKRPLPIQAQNINKLQQIPSQGNRCIANNFNVEILTMTVNQS